MKNTKNILIISIVITILITILSVENREVQSINNLRVAKEMPVRVSVLLRTLNDPYMVLLKQNFEEIQKKNEGKVEFIFYDSKNDQSLQYKDIDLILKNENVDLILVDLVDSGASKAIVDKVKQKNIPLGFFNVEPLNIETVKSYDKAYFVGTNPAEAGILQGKILINLWNKDKSIVDKNKDNIMQYVMLMGPRNNLEAIGRTKYSILSINDAGIKTEEIGLRVGNWEEELAKEAINALFLKSGNKIEAIISNNDAMAIGAIKALQKYGYNNGDKNKIIPIVGIDAIPEAQELVKKGVMTGSVVQDPYAMAEAAYLVGINLVNGREPLQGTPYKFDETGVSVRIPYREYIFNQDAV